MNKELNIGDYVRTKYGIAKIESFELKNKEMINLDKDIILCNMDIYRNRCSINQVIKSSSNVIDLIEVGDYVNGDRVKALKGDIDSHKINNEEDVIYTEYINDYDEWCGYEEDEIKSILTKEQFESMEYKIGE